MSNSENEMPGGEIPGPGMNEAAEVSGQMPFEDGEMPQGSMMADAMDNLGDQMPLGGLEMPQGEMNGEATDNFNGQMPLEGGEMPYGSMTENGGTAFVGAQEPIAEDEMPSGNMNEEGAALDTAQDKLMTIDIPGSWKLQLTYSS